MDTIDKFAITYTVTRMPLGDAHVAYCAMAGDTPVAHYRIVPELIVIAINIGLPLKALDLSWHRDGAGLALSW